MKSNVNQKSKIMKSKSYSTNKKCCKEHKSLISVKQINQSFETECNDCGKKTKGEKEVTAFLLS